MCSRKHEENDKTREYEKKGNINGPFTIRNLAELDLVFWFKAFACLSQILLTCLVRVIGLLFSLNSPWVLVPLQNRADRWTCKLWQVRNVQHIQSTCRHSDHRNLLLGCQMFFAFSSLGFGKFSFFLSFFFFLKTKMKRVSVYLLLLNVIKQQ